MSAGECSQRRRTKSCDACTIHRIQSNLFCYAIHARAELQRHEHVRYCVPVEWAYGLFIVRKIPWIMHFFPLQFEIFSHVYALRMISHNSHFPLFSADEFWFCHCIIASQKILNNRCNHEHWRSKIRCDIGHRLLQEACIIKWIYALWYCMPHSYVAEQMGIRNASQRTDIDC